MNDPFLGEIRAFSFNYAPKNWATCDGQLLNINQHRGFFSIIGTTYGGTGQTQFALPDLRGRAPIHFGSQSQGYGPIGKKSGFEKVALTEATVPEHRHVVVASNDLANQTQPEGNYLAQGVKRSGKVTEDWPTYADGTPEVELAPVTIGNVGRSLPHENRQPYLVLKYCIALEGTWPSRPD